jgi:hypothetical protein
MILDLVVVLKVLNLGIKVRTSPASKHFNIQKEPGNDITLVGNNMGLPPDS